MTPKQIHILLALSNATDWMTRQEMIPVAGKKGYSAALGTATKKILKGTLEHLGYVIRENDHTPFRYKITQAGRDAIANHLTAETAIRENFDSAVADALNLSASVRRARLAKAQKIPTVVVTQTNTFLRNPDVVAEVLYNARGVCGGCKRPAPFKRRIDGTPYLEVHHINQLAKGGEDTVENAIALCPNCHRRAHFA